VIPLYFSRLPNLFPTNFIFKSQTRRISKANLFINDFLSQLLYVLDCSEGDFLKIKKE